MSILGARPDKARARGGAVKHIAADRAPLRVRTFKDSTGHGARADPAYRTGRSEGMNGNCAGRSGCVGTTTDPVQRRILA
jgi:hypothetical protein